MDQPVAAADRRATWPSWAPRSAATSSRNCSASTATAGGRRRRRRRWASTADRNAQFENIARLKREYLGSAYPIVSIDTKKKELIGDFYRDGRLGRQGTIEINDHDFPSIASGVVIPHGIYDVGRNRGFVHLNTSHDTSELACDSIAPWWEEQGRAVYPGATSILLLCDGGGSNSATQYLFKEDLQGLVDRLGHRDPGGALPAVLLEVQPDRASAVPARDAGLPGGDLPDVETVKHFMEKAGTSTGLEVTVDILEKVYETGRKYAAGFKETMKIVFDELLPKWNYRAVPSRS